jgi:hypothetical protein
VGPGTGLDVKKRKILPLTGIELRPAHSQSLHGLCYPRSCTTKKEEGGFKLSSYDMTRNNVVTLTLCPRGPGPYYTQRMHNELNSRGRLETCIDFE